MTATPLLAPARPARGPAGLGAAAARAPAPDAGTLAVANAALRGGFVLLPRTLLHAPGLSRDAKLLYAVLLSYAWQAGSCFPGSDRLQHDLGCGMNQVTRYLQELEGGRPGHPAPAGPGQDDALHPPRPAGAAAQGLEPDPPKTDSRRQGPRLPESVSPGLHRIR